MGGQAAHSPHRPDQSCCRGEVAHSCSPAPPRGRPRLSEGTRAAFGGACGKPIADALCSQTQALLGEGEMNPLVVLKSRGEESKHTENAKTTHLMSAYLSETTPSFPGTLLKTNRQRD